MVGLRIVGKGLGGGIEAELAAEPVLQAVERDPVGFEMLFHRGECLVSLLVVAEGAGCFVERHFRTQPLRDVEKVAKCRGVVPLEDVGIEVFNFAAAHGRDEVAEVSFSGAASTGRFTTLLSGTALLSPFG